LNSWVFHDLAPPPESLEQGRALQRLLDGCDRQIKGRSEFDQPASELGRLAGAYGVTFPMAQGAAPRRHNGTRTGQFVGAHQLA
jgi:hypothetical protein